MQREIPSLDGLRAVSILFVIVSHSFGPVTDHTFLFNLLLKHGGLGVRIFFIISGFLITTLCLEERRRFGSLSLHLFYLRRALRILPAFYLYAGSMLVLGLIGRLPIGADNWIYVFTWTVNYNPNPAWFVAHLWSLSVEEQFYLAWPLMLKVLRPGSWTGWAMAAIFGGLLLRVIQFTTNMPWMDAARLPYAFPFVSAPIALGSLMAIYAPQMERFVKGRSVSQVALTLVATMLFETATEMGEGTIRPVAELLVDSVFTLFVAWCVFTPSNIFGAVLNCAPMVFLGKLSYSLYLWQELFVWRTDRPLYSIAPAWAATFLCAALSFYLLERPFLSLRTRLRRH